MKHTYPFFGGDSAIVEMNEIPYYSPNSSNHSRYCGSSTGYCTHHNLFQIVQCKE